VVRVLLGFSLLVSFTTSAAAALCLQMEHRDSAGMMAAMVGMDSPGQTTTNSDDMTPASGAQESSSVHACCHQQVSTAPATVASQRALPDGQTDALPAGAAPTRTDDGRLPPWLFDPALEKRDHLKPSLTALSISRT